MHAGILSPHRLKPELHTRMRTVSPRRSSRTSSHIEVHRAGKPIKVLRWRIFGIFKDFPSVISAFFILAVSAQSAPLVVTNLQVEWLPNPQGIDSPAPRLSWRVESDERGQRQTAYRVIAASTGEQLTHNHGDLWDTGTVPGDETINITYTGKPLVSGQPVYWKVCAWDKDGAASAWSQPAYWSMGLLHPEDWHAQWISFRDTSPVYRGDELNLPPVNFYRTDFKTKKKNIRRATVYASALGLMELYVNGERLGDAWFEPGWSDYHKRVYYRTYDATLLVQKGTNAIGAIVADGWYAGYVGFGLLDHLGPNRSGRNFYGKTPALLAQLEIEYTDGTRDLILTDPTWKVTGRGPIQQADLLMGETYDARAELGNWSLPGYSADGWETAIPARENGSARAVFSDGGGERLAELGFQRPQRMQAYCAPPIRVTQELAAKAVTHPAPGIYIFDLGQNFAGNIRLKVNGPAGGRVQIRYGEKLLPNGTLMTENLRRARATDFYILRGDPNGEIWTPHFTYHGFQYVELSGLATAPDLDAVTGLVLHNDTPLTGSFECSDAVLSKFGTNALWTQRANFVEVPTDCPQRDERLGWMGDAQSFIRAATFNADVAAFFTKWLDDVEEAQRDFGAYPDYCPFPMTAGDSAKSFATAWTDAGVICPWTIWKVYGDTRIIDRHWASLTRFMDWRASATAPSGLGASLGNPYGDWLNVGEPTPIELIDTCYHALDCNLMAEMAVATERELEAANYKKRFGAIRAAFEKAYLNEDGSLKIDSQTAYALALWSGVVRDETAAKVAAKLADKIARNGFRMTTGFLGARALLPALSANGQNDLAIRLFQNRQFPSWAYEVENGANTVWERWDSYTKEHGFEGQGGNQNASMNSFNHYAFGSVMEWAYRDLAGIDTADAGYHQIIIRPGPPILDVDPYNQPISWVKANYNSARGLISSAWERKGDNFDLTVTIPANTTATVFLPAKSADTITEGGQPLAEVAGVNFLRMEGDRAIIAIKSGQYYFSAPLPRGP